MDNRSPRASSNQDTADHVNLRAKFQPIKTGEKKNPIHINVSYVIHSKPKFSLWFEIWNLSLITSFRPLILGHVPCFRSRNISFNLKQMAVWSLGEWLQFPTLRTGSIYSYPNGKRMRRNNKTKIHSKHSLGPSELTVLLISHCILTTENSVPLQILCTLIASNCTIQKYIGHPIYAVYYNSIKKYTCTGWKKGNVENFQGET